MSFNRKLRAKKSRPNYSLLRLELLEHRVVPCITGLDELSDLDQDNDRDHTATEELGTFPAITDTPVASSGASSGDDLVALGDNPGLIVPAYSSLPGARATL